MMLIKLQDNSFWVKKSVWLDGRRFASQKPKIFTLGNGGNEEFIVGEMGAYKIHQERAKYLNLRDQLADVMVFKEGS